MISKERKEILDMLSRLDNIPHRFSDSPSDWMMRAIELLLRIELSKMHGGTRVDGTG